jgi:glycopeptide antibiotics resistance protein
MLRPPRIALAARVMLAPYLAVLFWIVFAPAEDAGRVTGVVALAAQLLAGIGIPFDLSYLVLEFLANVALFLPLGALLAVAFARLPWWAIVGIGFVTSVAIELVQLGLPSRFSTVSDVVANTLGTALGLLLTAATLARVTKQR